jgi:DNA-binding transcriptional LysR family regulator
MRYRSMSGVANAVAASIGLGPLPTIFFEDPAFKDILMPVMTEYRFRERTLYLVYVSRRYLPLKIRAFVDFILESISKVQPPKVARRPDSSQE